MGFHVAATHALVSAHESQYVHEVEVPELPMEGQLERFYPILTEGRP